MVRDLLKLNVQVAVVFLLVSDEKHPIDKTCGRGTDTMHVVFNRRTRIKGSWLENI